MRSSCEALAVCLWALMVPAPAGAQVTATTGRAGTIVIDTVHAPGLAANLLGDVERQSVAVYLPPSYDQSTTHRYPVLYLLHGIGGSHTDWTSPTYDGMTVQRTLDSLIGTGAVREMIVVMPNGRNRYGGSLYENSSVIGNWEQYIARDLVQHIDARFRTVPRRESRGIAGHSMGGYGALIMGARHPDVFSVVYAMSPCCLDLIGDLAGTNQSWRTFLEARGIDDLMAELRRRNLYPMAYLAILAALSPDPARTPFLVAAPYAVSGGRVTDADSVQAALRARMFLSRIPEYAGSLARLRGLRVDYGTREEFSHIVMGTSRLSAELASRGIPHGLDVYVGTHRDRIDERVSQVVLPYFDRLLEFETAPGRPTGGRR